MKQLWKNRGYNKKVFSYWKDKIKDPLVAMLLATRPHPPTSIEEYNFMKSGKLSEAELEDPDNINGTKEFRQIFSKNNFPKNVVVFGDYDVDGTFSTFMMRKLMKELNVEKLQYHVPDRFKTGYGMSPDACVSFIETFKGQDIDVIILLDCATNSGVEIKKLKDEFNCKAIVVDHHIISQDINCLDVVDAFVSCHDEIDGEPYCTPYCTGGLVFQIVRAIAKDYPHINEDKYAGYAGVTTVADMVEFSYNNKIIVAQGLKKMHLCEEIGFHELFKVAEVEIEKCTTEDIGWKIGPRINANGRIKHARIIQNLLDCEDQTKVEELADIINTTNEDRKDLTKKIQNEAIERLEPIMEGRDSILICDPSWNVGVVGIVASRLMERFKVPVIVFGGIYDKVKGSARSLSGINVKKVMDNVKHLFKGHGGHKFAAGAELKPECVDIAWKEFNKAIVEYKEEHNIDSYTVNYDIGLTKETFKKIDIKFFRKIKLLEPFGQANFSPRFRVKGVKFDNIYCWKNDSGAFLRINGMIPDFYTRMRGTEDLKGKTLDLIIAVEKHFADDKKNQHVLVLKHAKESEE